MSVVTVQVKGLRELSRELDSMAARVVNEGGNKMTQAGANVIRDEAKRLCPVVTGNLKRSIMTRKWRDARTGRAEYWVTFATKRTGGRANADGWYAHIVEYGPVKGPYEIEPDRKKALAFEWMGHGGRSATDRWRTVLSRVRHKTWRARPFLRPAFDHNWERALEAERRVLQAFVEDKRAEQFMSGELL